MKKKEYKTTKVLLNKTETINNHFKYLIIMEITSVPLTRLGVASKIQFFENILSIIDSNDATLLKVESQSSALKTRWQELSNLYTTDAKNPLSQEIYNLDLQRDECLLSLWLIIEGYSHSPINEMKLAGEKLLRNISLYANSPYSFAKQSYDVETSNITNLLSGWQTDTELKNAVNVLGVLQTTTILADLNTQHKTKLLARNEMYAAETTDTSKQKQAEATTAYYELCKALNSFAYVTPSSLYTKTINEINALIDSINLSLKQKAGRKKEKSPEQV